MNRKNQLLLSFHLAFLRLEALIGALAVQQGQSIMVEKFRFSQKYKRMNDDVKRHRLASVESFQ
jgi:hypothetical protein